MSHLPSFNFPMFHAVAAKLRALSIDVVSPAETDPPDVQAAAMASPDGAYDPKMSETWGDALARDVKMLADGAYDPKTGLPTPIDGIVFLPGWEKSKGARLESFVGLLTGKKFFEWDVAAELPLPRPDAWVHNALMNPWLDAQRKMNREFRNYRHV